MSREFKFKKGERLSVGTMYGIGKNYAKHAVEMGGEVPKEPIIFIKPPVCYVENGESITLPAMSENVHHEVELVVVIGKRCENISQENAREYIAGYAVGLDLTMRDIQNQAKDKGQPWAVAKGFYRSAPISEVIPADEFGDDIPFFDLKLDVNGETRQSSNTKYMERTVATLVEYLSKVFTLEPGDCIFTGTPEGVGKIVSGDKLKAELVNFATLEIEIN